MFKIVDNISTFPSNKKTTVAKLKSWNSLTSNKLSIGKQLIVGKKAVPAPQPKPEPQNNEYTRAESSSEGSNIISSYLKDQLKKVEKNNIQDESEDISETGEGVETELSGMELEVEEGGETSPLE